MKDTKKSRIPIIAMTANAFAEDVQKVLSVGMNDHVAKPVDINILVSTMMKISIIDRFMKNLQIFLPLAFCPLTEFVKH